MYQIPTQFQFYSVLWQFLVIYIRLFFFFFFFFFFKKVITSIEKKFGQRAKRTATANPASMNRPNMLGTGAKGARPVSHGIFNGRAASSTAVNR